MQLRLFQAKWQLGDLSPEKVHEEATRLLEAGLESPALITLAGAIEASSRGELDSLISTALTELGAAPMSDTDARWTLVFDTAERLVAKDEVPEHGARKLWDLATDLEWPGQPLDYFGYLGADYGDGPMWSVEDAAWFDARILETAQELLDEREAILAWVRQVV
jgi:hypothetical protein